jgi:hypothetical protein
MIPINSLLNNGEGFNSKIASSNNLGHNDKLNIILRSSEM